MAEKTNQKSFVEPRRVINTPVLQKKTNNTSHKKMSYKKKLQLVNAMVNKIRHDLTNQVHSDPANTSMQF